MERYLQMKQNKGCDITIWGACLGSVMGGRKSEGECFSGTSWIYCRASLSPLPLLYLPSSPLSFSVFFLFSAVLSISMYYTKSAQKTGLKPFSRDFACVSILHVSVCLFFVSERLQKSGFSAENKPFVSLYLSLSFPLSRSPRWWRGFLLCAYIIQVSLFFMIPSP